MESKVFSVSELVEYVNGQLSEEIVVEGEISRIDVRQGNLVFITLVDAYSALDVFGLVFRLRNIDALTEGMRVRVFGTPGLYKKSGRFRIDASVIIPAGEGALRIAYERLKAQLEAEGLFDVSRKRKITRFPERIALITAPKSQAYSDFIKVLRERFGGIKVEFYPVKVQGRGAEQTIARALETASQHKKTYDAIVLIRGGGSLEDLAAFNSEEVARAVFAAQFPVIVGVGHEGDVSLADFVSDIRASTPSNAAELLVPERNAITQEVEYLVSQIERRLSESFETRRTRITQGIIHIQSVVVAAIERLRTLYTRLTQSKTLLLTQALHFRTEIAEREARIFGSMEYSFKIAKTNILHLQRVIASLRPEAVLARGYSIIQTESGTIIKTSGQVRAHQIVHATLSSGKIKARVISHDGKSKENKL